MTRWPLLSKRLVIADFNDAPQAKMTAIVLGRDGDLFVWRYVAAEPGYAYREGQHVGALPDATAIDAFGVALFLEEEEAGLFLTAERVGPSRTMYSDHTLREWCEVAGFTRVPVHADVAPALLKLAARGAEKVAA